MAEKPILFSGAMVRAILDGKKTQTRRVVKCGNGVWVEHDLYPFGECAWPVRVTDEGQQPVVCPYGNAGDRLWVRETHRALDHNDMDTCIEYRADGAYMKPSWPDEATGWKWEQDSLSTDWEKWRPSIFMPRWASRITLRVDAVRVERLNDITNEDAWREGIDTPEMPITEPDGSRHQAHGWEGIWAFKRLWDSINAKRGYGWDSNPWVWVVEFEQVDNKGDRQGLLECADRLNSLVENLRE